MENVYIFTTIKDDYNKSHFLTISELNWELVGEFYSGALKIGLFKLIKNDSNLENLIEEL